MPSKRILIAVTIVTALVGCQLAEETVIPEDLIGVWKTSSARYEDRFFELSRDVIIFGTGGTTYTAHAIVDVDKNRQADRILYTLSYSGSEGGQYQFSFYYDAAQGTIRFKNQEQIEWRKSAAD